MEGASRWEVPSLASRALVRYGVLPKGAAPDLKLYRKGTVTSCCQYGKDQLRDGDVK